ncbi:MAG: tRNA pseudouridine synthase B [uncultured bacterium (gcode 4)]|uniref:tRNA pseudouridine(55) synthase n=1 Tax=uncultured bacterium (gcode 4) TaxID=1234023 RepID=K2F719_9BACT|nr:MAG: tRNA pseudouridine synthase B [uncultured bacterium (gcode 4)]
MFYLLNKPSWISSFWEISKLRKLLNIKKVWHTWTLDPLATWLLLVATWNSTKLIPYLEKSQKTYEFTFNLDWFTETWDLWSEIHFLPKELIDSNKGKITPEGIEEILKKDFSWKITQIPPKYSAISIDWQRAYNLARNWKEVIIPSRTIEIFEYTLLDFNFPSVTISMTVSAWTYIRTIAEDIWKKFWLNAYTINLHRSKISNLDESMSFKLADIRNHEEMKKFELSYDYLFSDFWEIILKDNEITKILKWYILKNEYWLNEWQKYFIKDERWDYVSLVEVKNNELVILSNRI